MRTPRRPSGTLRTPRDPSDPRGLRNPSGTSGPGGPPGTSGPSASGTLRAPRDSGPSGPRLGPLGRLEQPGHPPMSGGVRASLFAKSWGAVVPPLRQTPRGRGLASSRLKLHLSPEGTGTPSSRWLLECAPPLGSVHRKFVRYWVASFAAPFACLACVSMQRFSSGLLRAPRRGRGRRMFECGTSVLACHNACFLPRVIFCLVLGSSVSVLGGTVRAPVYK